MTKTKWYAKPIYLLVALVLVLTLSLVTAAPVAATTLTVDTSAPVSATNFHTIQDAVDNAGAGDTITVAAGTYNENVVVHKDVTLQSAKKHKAVVVGVNVGVYATWAWDVFRVIADGATVEGFDVRMFIPTPPVDWATWDGHDGIAVKANGVTVRDNKVEGPGPFTGWVHSTGAGISAILCDDVTIENNHVRYTNGVGLWLTCTNSLISKNHIEGTQYTGILLAPWGASYNHGNLIAENKVKKCGTQWNSDDGIRLGAGAYDNVVWNNHVDGSSRSGIKAVSSTHDNTIVGNKMKGSPGPGGGFDAHDQSAGTRTAGTANWWAGNKGKTSSPDGLCK